MQILITEIERLRKELNNTITSFQKAGYKKAKYRIALAKELLILRDKGLPATLTNYVARGNENIAKLKFNRDVKDISISDRAGANKWSLKRINYAGEVYY